MRNGEPKRETLPERRRFRTGFLTDGTRVTWEYPRQTGLSLRS